MIEMNKRSGENFMKSRIHILCAAALLLASVAWSQTAPASPNHASSPATVPCNGPGGARFNLEPRANAAAQNEPAVDFLLNRVAPSDDLIVEVANDNRGNLKNINWDGSVSGYYVHSSKTADCSVQFEGGLPSITSGGVTYTGTGNVVVAADPARDAFFVADSRLGPITTNAGTGLFRVSASTLLNPSACPSGTHTAAQAASCWAATPPTLIPGSLGVFPQISIDERATNAGVGAGDVYVLGLGAANNAPALLLNACTNSLNCGSAATIAGSSPGFEYMRVRSDGLITISYAQLNTDGTNDIFFVTCTPAGAPKAPTCGTPILAQHVAVPISSSFGVLFPLTNIQMLTFTYPKHASRSETGRKFTTFLVYDDCKNPFTFQNPPVTACVDAEVVMITSTDDGKTWSAPVSVDTAKGHHFFPTIATDTSTGIVNVAYYSAEGDRFNHKVRVMMNQIKAGSISAGTPKALTENTTIDPPPQRTNQSQSDFFFGMMARGDSVSGQSHLYAAFDSTAFTGSYNGRPLPELNNGITMITY
jgi:hypothetical protein